MRSRTNLSARSARARFLLATSASSVTSATLRKHRASSTCPSRNIGLGVQYDMEGSVEAAACSSWEVGEVFISPAHRKWGTCNNRFQTSSALCLRSPRPECYDSSCRAGEVHSCLAVGGTHARMRIAAVNLEHSSYPDFLLSPAKFSLHRAQMRKAGFTEGDELTLPPSSGAPPLQRCTSRLP